MSILERMNKAIEDIDTATMEELVHDDFKFHFHSNGNSLGKNDIIEWVKSGDVKNIAKLRMELERLAAVGGKDKIVPNEGIVFTYKGGTYKLTGTFASLNQILGLMYF